MNGFESVDDFLKRGGVIEKDDKFEISDVNTYHIKNYLVSLGCKWNDLRRCWTAPNKVAWDKAQLRLVEYSSSAGSQRVAIRTANSRWTRNDQHKHVPKQKPITSKWKGYKNVREV